MEDATNTRFLIYFYLFVNKILKIFNFSLFKLLLPIQSKALNATVIEYKISFIIIFLLLCCCYCKKSKELRHKCSPPDPISAVEIIMCKNL